MSRVSDAKEKQGYRPKAPTCSDCLRLTFERRLPAWMVESNETTAKLSPNSPVRQYREVFTVEKHGIEKGHTCTLGNFAVKKSGHCAFWTPKELPNG